MCGANKANSSTSCTLYRSAAYPNRSSQGTGEFDNSSERCLTRFNEPKMASTTTPASPVNTPASSNQGQAPAGKPSAPPINILSGHLAQAYSLVHPALLLGLCILRFESLVADPVKELLKDLPWLTLLQFFYIMLCLPPAGTTSPTDTSSADEDKKKATRSPAGSSVTLKPGKPGYRRKQHSGKGQLAGLLAKLMVRGLTDPRIQGDNSNQNH